jgi:hypothetical protein
LQHTFVSFFPLEEKSLLVIIVKERPAVLSKLIKEKARGVKLLANLLNEWLAATQQPDQQLSSEIN